MKGRAAAVASAIPTYACCSWRRSVSKWSTIMSSFSFHRLKDIGTWRVGWQ
jgi:hypothetical protein